jgi:anti-sigma B factor antagonist
MGLQIKNWQQDEVTMVEVRGKLIMHYGPKLHDEIKRLMAGGSKRFLMDFSGVEYIDSFGIGQMVSVQNSVRSSGGQIRYAGFAAKVMSLLEISAVPTILEFDPDVSTSLNKLGGS